MAIRRSAAAEIEHLLSDLCGADAIARETAGARLTVIGVRAVPHLIVAFDRAPASGARVASKRPDLTRPTTSIFATACWLTASTNC